MHAKHVRLPRCLYPNSKSKPCSSYDRLKETPWPPLRAADEYSCNFRDRYDGDTFEKTSSLRETRVPRGRGYNQIPQTSHSSAVIPTLLVGTQSSMVVTKTKVSSDSSAAGRWTLVC